jgi:hypothetical protein
LCWIFFNPTAFLILLAAMVLGSLYSTHLRDKVGYLSLPPIEGLIFLCGWAALSPGTVFTTFLPWYLYLLGVVWQSAHILAHYVLISARCFRQPKMVTPAIFKTLRRAAARLTMVRSALFTASALLPLLTSLSWLYTSCGAYALCHINAGRFEVVPISTDAPLSALSLRLVISAAIILGILYH